MRTIYKYPFKISSRFTLGLPYGSNIISAGIQGSLPVLWAEVDPEQREITRHLAVIGTGHQLPENATFIATFQDPPFVWHLYELDQQRMTVCSFWFPTSSASWIAVAP
jgi:hypothetical protein